MQHPRIQRRHFLSFSVVLSEESCIEIHYICKSSYWKAPSDISLPTTSPSLPNTPPTPPAWLLPPPPDTVHPPSICGDDYEIMSPDDKNSTHQATLTKRPMNDGTNRLNIKWKPKADFQLLAENCSAWWLKTFHSILQSTFTDCDGLIFRWESADLKTFTTITALTLA